MNAARARFAKSARRPGARDDQEASPLATVAAFEALFRRNERALRQLAFGLLGTKEEMEDALQEACLRAFRAAPKFHERPAGSADGWLYRVTYRTCMDRLRERGRTRSWLDSTQLAGGSLAAPEDSAGTAIVRLDVESALSKLAPELRAVVLLVDAIGMDYATSAAVLGIRPGTLASRLSRARNALRAVFELPKDERRTTHEP